MVTRASVPAGRPEEAPRLTPQSTHGLPYEQSLPATLAGPRVGDHFSVEPRSIGRERYLVRLLDGLKTVLSGSSWACLISGEAGIGKTRLLQDLLDRAQAHDCHLLRGRAQDFDQGISYATLRDVLTSAAADDFAEPSRASLSDLLQALDASAAHHTHAGGDDVARFQPTHLLVTRFLHSLCLSKPTIITLDDAHLSDDETLTALFLAARHLAQLPLFMVFTTRSDKWVPGSRFAETVGRLFDAGQGDVIDLSPLDAEETTALIAADLGGRPDDRLTAYVYHQSRGNPLYTRQALCSLRELGAIRAEHGRYYLVGDPVMGGLSRRAALLHRVFQQDRASRELARVMSAFKRVHLDQIGALESVTDLDRGAIEQAFDALTRASIMTRVANGWYEFSHPLIAEVLYNDLGPLERRLLHKLIAETFSERELAGADVLEWTRHVAEAAAPGDRAAIDAVLEAARITRNTAPLSSATWYERALDLMPPGAPDRGAALCRQAIALWKGSRPESAVEVGNRALEAQAGGDLRARTVAMMINATFSMGRYKEALRLSETQAKHGYETAPFLAQRALLLAHTGDSSEAVVQVNRAEVEARSGSTGDQVVTYSYIGHVSNCLGDFRRVRLAVDRLITIGEGVGPELEQGARLSALESAAFLLAKAGSLADARGLLAKVAGRLPATGWQDVGGQSAWTKAKLEHTAGEWDAALASIRSAAVSLEASGLGQNLMSLRLLEASILIEQAHVEEAAKLLESSAADLECTLHAVMHQWLAARIAGALGDYATARDILTSQSQITDDTNLADARRRCLEGLLDVSILTDDLPAARQHADALRCLAQQTGLPAVVTAADLADVALRRSADPARLIAGLEAEGQMYAAAQAHLYFSAYAPEPDHHLNRANDLFSGMGANLWLARVSSQARRLGLSLARGRRRRAGKDAPLTQTEAQLAQLLRQGLTNRQISSVMLYSAKTIEVYVSRLYQKVGCRSRLELVMAVERGEIDLPSPSNA